MRHNQRATLDRRLRNAEIEVAKRTCKTIVEMLAEAHVAGTAADRDGINAAMRAFRRLSETDIDIVDLPRLILEAVARQAPAVAERAAAATGIAITIPFTTTVQE